MDKYLIVFNPNAANGAAAKQLESVKELLRTTGVPFDLELTAGPLHAVEIAKDGCRNGYEGIVAAGGDGTANEVLNGIMLESEGKESQPAFGTICIGRGNDFAHGAGIPGNTADVCKALADGSSFAMDVGRIICDGEVRYFGNGIGIGFDAMVNIEATKITWAQGFLSYFLGAMKTMFFYYDALPLEIVYNGKTETKLMIQISVMNGTRMGGAFYMTPDAKTDDGLLDVCIGHAPKRREMLGIILRYMNGSQGVSPHILFDQTRDLTVRSSDGKLVIQADGEIVTTTGRGVGIECLHHAVRVIRPPRSVS